MSKKLYIRNRIKYYRKLLNITQNELSRNTISVQQIKYLETNKRNLTIKTAEILIDNFKCIAKEKNIKLEIAVEELMKNSRELAKDLCKKDLENLSEIDDEEFISICEEYEVNDILQMYFKSKAEEYEKNLNYEQARTFYLKAMDINVSEENTMLHIYIRNKLGRCNYLLGNLTLAMQEYVSCEYMIKESKKKENVELDDLISRTYYGIAAIYYVTSENSKSKIYIDKILTLEKPNPLIIVNSKMLLGNIFYKNNQFNEAEKVFRELEKDKPNDFNIKVSLAVLYRLIGDEELHLEYLKKLKGVANNDSSNSNFLIEYLIQLKNYYIKNDKNKAIKYCNQLVKYSFKYKNLMSIIRVYKNIVDDFNENLIDMTQLEEYLLVLYTNKEVIYNSGYLKNELSNIFLELVLHRNLNNSCINIIKKLREINI